MRFFFLFVVPAALAVACALDPQPDLPSGIEAADRGSDPTVAPPDSVGNTGGEVDDGFGAVGDLAGPAAGDDMNNTGEPAVVSEPNANDAGNYPDAGSGDAGQ